MPRKRSTVLNPAERRVMQVLWDRGEGTARDVMDFLNRSAESPFAYTTILTTLRILADKGHLRTTPRGRAHVFQPILGEADEVRRVLDGVIRDFFGGSPKALAQHLIDDVLDAETLKAIEADLDAAAKGAGDA